MIIHKRVKSMLPVVSKDNSRIQLTRLYVSDEEAVATDGHVLVRTPVDNSIDMPDAPGEPVAEPVLIDADVIEKAIKNLPARPKLPCNHHIQVTKDDEQLLVSSNVPVVSFPSQCAQGGYPDYKQVIPDYIGNDPLKFALDGKLLKVICDMAIKHGDTVNRITFEIPRDGGAILTNAVKFTIQNDEQDVFTGIIMPLRAKVE